MVGSFATSASDYVLLQIRKRSSGFHVQGKGVETNRYYGVSADLGVIATGLQEWVSKQTRDLSSLAETDQKYAECQAAIRGSNIHFQINGSKATEVAESLRREYGVAFDVPRKGNEFLADFVANKDNQIGEDDSDECSCEECIDDVDVTISVVINGVKYIKA